MEKYAVIFERSDSGYSAYAPEFPGCVAGAETLEETRELMAEAIRLYLEETK